MDLSLYYHYIRIKSNSVFGESEGFEEYNSPHMSKSPILQAWLEDDEVQEITLASSNLGFVRTYTKFYASHAEETDKMRLEIIHNGVSNE